MAGESIKGLQVPAFFVRPSNNMWAIFNFGRRSLQFICISASILSVVLASKIIEVDTPIGKISGFIDETIPRVTQFLGIPFAEPPIGPLRWLPARPKSPVPAINATSLEPSCSQYLTSLSNLYNTDAKGFLV